MSVGTAGGVEYGGLYDFWELFSRRAILPAERLGHADGAGGIGLVEMHELALNNFLGRTRHLKLKYCPRRSGASQFLAREFTSH